jgi:DNA-binding transcriptional MocR family regulator
MAGPERDTRREGSTAELSGFTWTPDRFNARVRAATPMPRAGGVPPDVISLAYGMPDPALFPAAGLAEAAQEALRDAATCAVALQYGNVGGNPLLLAELGRKLAAEEGPSLALPPLPTAL